MLKREKPQMVSQLKINPNSLWLSYFVYKDLRSLKWHLDVAYGGNLASTIHTPHIHISMSHQ